MTRTLILSFLLLVAWPARSQTGGAMVPAGGDEAMMAPPPVSMGGDSVAFTSELQRSNYLRGGISLQGSYDDNIFTTSPAEGDASYTISPNIAFDMSRSRLRWDLHYSPGFTFYQRFSAENQVNHDFSTTFQYELSPHVTLNLQDVLAKTPSFSSFLQPGTVGGAVNVGQSPAFLIVPPLVSTLSNSDSGQITYQFSPHSMVGMGGNSYELYFLGNSPLQGLSDSSVRGAQAFYSYRFGAKHYLGFHYNFEDMLAHSSGLETQVHGETLFYSLYFSPRASLSLFGGVQHADTEGLGLSALTGWSPTEGGGFHLQGINNSLAINVSRSIGTGGGLEGAVKSSTGNVSFRHQFTSHLTGNLQGTYSVNNVLQPGAQVETRGHTLYFGGSLQRSLGPRLGIELGYNRINQHYGSVGAISNNPNADRGWISISYQFARPLGR
jgi:hypothetical protein